MLIAFAQYFLPIFISVPSYVAVYASTALVYFCNEAKEVAPLKTFLGGFNVANCFIAAPLLAGILIDYIGVVATMPLFDTLLIIGEIISYFALKENVNVGMAIIGLFFIYFAYGLKETCKVVYLANTFIQKNQNGYQLKIFAIETALTLASIYIILFVDTIIAPDITSCVAQLKTLCLACLGFSLIGLFTSIALYYIDRLQKRNSGYALVYSNQENQNKSIFRVYNNRVDQTDDQTPTLGKVLKIIMHERNLPYLKFWILGAACMVAIATRHLQSSIMDDKYLAFAQIIITLLLIFAITEKRMRFLIIATTILMLVYQVCDFFDSSFVAWILAIYKPTALFLTDIYTPIVLNFNLQYLGTVVGIKKWIENIILFLATITQDKKPADNYLQLFFIILAIIFFLFYNERYINSRNVAPDLALEIRPEAQIEGNQSLQELRPLDRNE